MADQIGSTVYDPLAGNNTDNSQNQTLMPSAVADPNTSNQSWQTIGQYGGNLLRALFGQPSQSQGDSLSVSPSEQIKQEAVTDSYKKQIGDMADSTHPSVLANLIDNWSKAGGATPPAIQTGSSALNAQQSQTLSGLVGNRVTQDPSMYLNAQGQYTGTPAGVPQFLGAVPGVIPPTPPAGTVASTDVSETNSDSLRKFIPVGRAAPKGPLAFLFPGSETEQPGWGYDYISMLRGLAPNNGPQTETAQTKVLGQGMTGLNPQQQSEKDVGIYKAKLSGHADILTSQVNALKAYSDSMPVINKNVPGFNAGYKGKVDSAVGNILQEIGKLKSSLGENQFIENATYKDAKGNTSVYKNGSFQ